MNLIVYFRSANPKRALINSLLRDTWFVQTLKLCETLLESIPQIHLKMFYYLTLEKQAGAPPQAARELNISRNMKFTVWNTHEDNLGPNYSVSLSFVYIEALKSIVMLFWSQRNSWQYNRAPLCISFLQETICSSTRITSTRITPLVYW